MEFEEANAWCLREGVSVREEGRWLILWVRGTEVRDRLKSDSWFEWRGTFVRLVDELRRRPAVRRGTEHNHEDSS